MSDLVLDALSVFAGTLLGEASACGRPGMSHVASVVMNRVEHPRWWGHDILGVCQAPWQFSCWNKNDPNRARVMNLLDARFRGVRNPIVDIAFDIAQTAMQRRLQDATDGADSYYAISMATPPYWAAKAAHTFADAWHQFCRVELAGDVTEPDVPVVSVLSDADRLNQAFLERLHGAST